MAKKVWDAPIDKTVPWDGNSDTDNMPVRGTRVEEFIKETFEEKIGVLHYDVANNRYLAFADQANLEVYLADPTQTQLVLGTFDAPFNYSAEITLTSAAYNAVFYGSTGNYIDFTFDVKNKQGASTGENVTVTYTFIRNAVKQTFTETRKFGDNVHFNIDKYLGEGTNTIIVGITGQTTLAATTVAVTYQVVNLAISDNVDVSTMYNLSTGAKVMEVSYTVSGYGTKVVEWYIDGEQLPYVKVEDEVVDVSTTRTKYITLANLSQGTHSLQIRAYTTINGEKFYTDTIYRDIIVYTGVSSDLIIAMAATIPARYGVLGAGETPSLYDIIQYIPYELRFATYTSTNAQSTEVQVLIDGVLQGAVGSRNGVENKFTIISKTTGNKTLELKHGDTVYTVPIYVAETTMNLQEIKTDLMLDFSALGKSNGSPDRDVWEGNGYTGTLTGFNWNNTSGWVDNRLEMNAGSTFALNIAPLAGNPTSNGRTIEIEWSTKNVTNDDEVICDLRNDDGVGILITATKVSMRSSDGVVVETEYKSDENVRIGFVINRSSGVSNQRLSFIYANGIVSRGEKWAYSDSYTSDATILFRATEAAQVSLKSILVYNTALTSDQMLNNYTLYRDTVADMMTVYDRNDVYEDGTTVFSTDKMMSRLPVMIVTGDIPVLENTSDKDTQIVVNIDYYNMQDVSKSFRMVGAAMRPQGTSSMGYPKKNFRIYTRKVDGTILYDANGNIVENKLYSFKDKAQPVDCWCLKADYAESSGSHNTGIARLWNDALFNATVSIDLGKDNPHNVDGEYVLRTEAQKKALAAGYPYDVRTTIDGFPILLFYRPTANDDLIFIGKYNFNNDKSTESVFGFTGIPDFDNSHMQCWEVLNNGNALALFTTTEGFNEGWSEAFESRYPDTKTPNTDDLKAFCEWMVNVSEEDFTTQKWEHMDVFKMAAYWCYLMRHAGADQFVKNAMFTSEDGQKFYYILYDNDTINGLINTGRLRIKPTDNRQTVDEAGAYVFAGHDSRLWNMLENDLEFMQIVSAVDNALYSSGISYTNTIKIFDEEQADKWVERVYNQDAQYKYVGPFVEKGIDNLFMLQGKRDLHRRWWLAKRFSIYDAKFVSGTYKSQAMEFKCINGTPAGQQFSITAGYPLDYGYGINNVPRSFGITLGMGESHTFTTAEVVNLGDPIRVYAAPNIAKLDLSPMSSKLAVVTVTNAYDEALGTKLTHLILGNASQPNMEVTEISGLKQAVALEYLDVQGMTKMTSIDLTNHVYFKTLKAFGSGVASVAFPKGAPVERLELPSAMRVLSLEQLPYITTANVVMENKANLSGISIKNCPSLSNDFAFVYDWYSNKTTADDKCSLVMDNVLWENIDHNQLLQLFNLKLNGGNLDLKGRITLPTASLDIIHAIEEIFDETVFNEDSELYIKVPSAVYMDAPVASINEGESATFVATVYPVIAGTMKYSLTNSRTGASIDENTGVLTTTENGLATSSLTVKATFTPADGSAALTKTASISVVKRIYPTSITINGNPNPLEAPYTYTWSTTTANVNGNYIAEWVLSGDITSVARIESQDIEKCVMAQITAPADLVGGTLTLTLKKVVDGSLVATATKELQAMMEGVIITSTTNPGVQEALYNAGLVANQNYTLKAEVEVITAEQLQPGTSASTSIFANKISKCNFDEFKYFTALTKIPQYLFYGCWGSINQDKYSITLPPTIEVIEAYSFNSCQVGNLHLPPSVKEIKNYAFRYDRIKNVHIEDLSAFFNITYGGTDAIPGDANSGSYSNLVLNGEVIKDLIIPDGVETLKRYSLYGVNSTIETLYIPNSVSTISPNAIRLPNLRRISGGAGITKINGFGQSPNWSFMFDDNTNVEYTIAEGCTLGVFTHNVNSGLMIDSRNGYNIMGKAVVLKYGTYKFFTGVHMYFDDMTQEREVTLSYTGQTENITDRLRIAFMQVELTSNKPDAQFRIEYTNIHSGEQESAVVTGAGNHLLPIRPDSIFTVTGVTEYEGLTSPTVSKNTSTGTVVTCDYVERVDIYIQHIDGTLYTTDQWSAGGYANNQANGVALVSASTSFVIAKGNASSSNLKWGGYEKLINDITTTENKDTAALDFDGVGNTSKIIKQLADYTDSQSVVGAPAAEACVAYIFPNGKTGYLPALGQLQLVNDNNTAVTRAMNLIGGTVMPTSYCWSSTQSTAYNAWAWRQSNGSSYNRTKTSTSSVRAFSPYADLNISSNISTHFDVTYTNMQGKSATRTVGVGRTSFDVKMGTTMTITPRPVGNLVAESQTITWDDVEKTVSFVFAKDAGVYIQHVNGQLFTESEWSSGGYSNESANGVAVLSATAPAFVIAKNNASSSTLKWGGYGNTINGVLVADTESVARLDFDGAGNTQKIIEQYAGYTSNGIPGAPAAEAAAAYTFPNGKKGYLPALGELALVKDNAAEVLDLMSVIGGDTLHGGNTPFYVSSTIYDEYRVWYLMWINAEPTITTYNRTDSFRVRAFTSL